MSRLISLTTVSRLMKSSAGSLWISSSASLSRGKNSLQDTQGWWFNTYWHHNLQVLMPLRLSPRMKPMRVSNMLSLYHNGNNGTQHLQHPPPHSANLSCETRAATVAGLSSSNTAGDLATSLLMSVLGSASRNRMSLFAMACAAHRRLPSGLAAKHNFAGFLQRKCAATII